MSSTETRTDPFGLGMRAFARGAARSSCPFSPSFFEGRNWFRGWDYGRSRAAARQFRVGKGKGA
jgi:hypothetical protein